MRLPLLSALLATAVLGAAASDAQAPLVQAPSTAAPPYRDALLALHRSLIEQASPSGHEGDVAAWLQAYLRGRGYSTALMPVPRRANTDTASTDTANTATANARANVVAWLGDDDSTDVLFPPSLPRLLVTSHIDVVPPDIPYRIDNATGPATRRTVVAGRGSVDAKASVAAQITAVEALRQEGGGRPDVLLLFVVGEEDGGDGMRAFSEAMDRQHAATAAAAWFRAALFGEPTENRLACGHKGILNCHVTAAGRAGHSGYPARGRSATALLVRALAAVLDADLGASPRFGNTTVNVGRMAGGVAANVIAAEAHADLTVRVALGPQDGGQDVVRQRIEAAVAGAAATAAPGESDALRVHCPVGYGVVACACAVPGFPNPITVNYGTDVPNLAGNHTRYLYGPGDILVAHGDAEAITVGALEDAVEAYKRLITYALAD